MNFHEMGRRVAIGFWCPQKKDGPDYGPMAAVAAEQLKLSKEAMDWYTAEYERTRPDREAAQQRAMAVSDKQYEALDFATQQAKDMDRRNKTVFQPLEDKIVSDAQDFDTTGRRLQAMSEARADVESGYGAAQAGLTRNLARMSVAPDSGRSLTLMQDAALDKAKALAGATGGAVKNIEQQGYARKMDAAALGKGIVGNQATQQQIATSTGNASTGNASGALNASMSGAGLMGQGFNTAMQGNAQAGQLYGQIANMQSQEDDGLFGALGQLGGAAIMKFSDENMKTNTDKPADTKKMLKMVTGPKVMKDWKYDPAKGGPDDGGAPHDGPMAQDVQKHMGDKAAPGGKVIDLVTMNGQMMGAIQELAKQQAGIKRKLAKMEMAA